MQLIIKNKSKKRKRLIKLLNKYKIAYSIRTTNFHIIFNVFELKDEFIREVIQIEGLAVQ